MIKLNSIKFKFTLAIFVSIAAVTFVLGVVSYEYEKLAIQNRVYAQLNAIADLKKELVVKYVAERVNDLKILSASAYQRKNVSLLLGASESSSIKKAAHDRIVQRLNSLKDIYPEYRELEVIDLNGVVLARSEAGPGFRKTPGGHGDNPLRSLDVDALKQGVTLILQDGLGAGHLDFVTGMGDDEGRIRAVIIGRVGLAESIFPLFSDYTGLGHTGETLLLKRDGSRITYLNTTRYESRSSTLSMNPDPQYMKLAMLAVDGNEGIDQAIDYRGEEVIGVYRYIPRLGWGLVTKIDKEEAFAEITALQKKTFLLASAVLLVMLGLAYALGRTLTLPIEKLIINTKMITAGHFSGLEKSGRTDEIGELEDNFGEMVIALGAARHHAGIKQADLERQVTERTENLSRANAALSTALEDIRRETGEKKALEAQLLHAQKMEAVGTLAGGIAHDFNNILTAIIGYGGIMRLKLAEDDPNRGYIDQILAVSERAANLTRSLLAFSRKQIAEPRPVRLNGIIERVGGLLSRIIGEDIDLRTKLDHADPAIMADPGQVEQILMNLATNARDAMSGAGCFTIATETAAIDADFIALHGYGEAGKYAVMTVSDTGAGMDEKIRERIFEPFFTTKETGKGTGLGLSIVYGIVKAQRGYINCYSEPGKGATFKVYLPLTEEEVGPGDGLSLRQPRGGTETILVAEDSSEVRRLTTTILAEAGYRVIEAVDGVDAVKKFTENREAVSLLLFDVIMPGKNGKDAYDDIAAMRPGVKVIFTSGYTADIVHGRGLSDKDLPLLNKPLLPRDLLVKIREVLDNK